MRDSVSRTVTPRGYKDLLYLQTYQGEDNDEERVEQETAHVRPEHAATIIPMLNRQARQRRKRNIY